MSTSSSSGPAPAAESGTPPTSPSAPPAGPRRSELKQALGELTLREEHRLRRRLDRSRTPKELSALAADIARAGAAVAAVVEQDPVLAFLVHGRDDGILAHVRLEEVTGFPELVLVGDE